MRTLFFIAFTLLISGCGLIPRTGTPSEALKIADAMGVPAADMPRAQYDKLLAQQQTPNAPKISDDAISGATHLLASGDPTMLLLSGFSARSISANVQLVAWVPEDIASSPEKAVEISSKAYIEASANARARSEEERQRMLKYPVRYVLGQPYGEGGPVHASAQLLDLIANHTPALVDAPPFMNTRSKVYGPIFIGAWGGHSKAEDVQATLRMSSLLPHWFYIYSPGLAGVTPPSIMNRGKQQLFIQP
ncbi:hypothetical protein [Pseudomonas sp. GV071]|uniref:hypothetical protein n=1 Tax=Pseudomonas sp. GV071 TaxID=2135754 RepID=UPI000D3BAD68|nr:hypothetical protein [Pseudomonas sp. GV071]PTQ68198.1 hypothetical protein C8K61_112115 [Pseudomonas sp. GV071]